MLQFDVCRNRGKSREVFPYFVVVQSREFVRAKRRVVIPLTTEVARYPEIAPTFEVEGRKVVADALLIFSIPLEKLGKVVTSFSDDTSAGLLLGAIDRVIAQR
jgi:mRNA-degrading endonuclease toxin of MazEF toxin-antitoxin module